MSKDADRPATMITLALSSAIDDTLEEIKYLLQQWTADQAQFMANDVDKVCWRDASVRLSRWIRRLVIESDSCSVVYNKLITLAKMYIEHPDSTEDVPRDLLPSKRDKASTVDEERESSPEFWLIECITLICEECPDAIIDDDVVSFVFARLSTTSRIAVRHIASRCVAAMSHMHLSYIVNLILHRLRSCRGNTELRDYAIIQKAVAGLSFEFSDTKIDITIHYLQELVKLAIKIERGVLRAEVCYSLKAMFIGLLGSNQRNFLLESSCAAAFWTTYTDIYQIVGKWSRKSKHALFSYELMMTMICFGEYEFFISNNRDDVLKMVVGGLKKEELRVGCLDLIRAYVRDVDSSFFHDDQDAFLKQMRSVSSALISRKKVLPSTEMELLEAILIEIGRKHMKFCVNDIAVDILKYKSGFSNSYKTMVLHSLCRVANELPLDIAIFSYSIGPLVAAIIESGGTDAELICAALSCFPAIRNPNHDRVKTTGMQVASLTLHGTHSIAVTASGSLHQFAIRLPDTALVFSLFSLVDVLYNLHDIELDVGIRTLNNIKVILISYNEYLQRNSDAKLVPFAEWISIRHHLEGIAILWMCHHEKWVRDEAFGLLDIFKSKGLRSLENVTALANISVTTLQKQDKLRILADCLILKEETHTMNEESCPELDELVRNSYHIFEGVISWAWSTTLQWQSLVIEQELQHDAYNLWRNQFRFLCIAARPGEHADTALTSERYRTDYVAKRSSMQSLRQSFVSLKMSASELIQFCSVMFTLIHSSNKRLRDDALRMMSLLHYTVFDQVASQMKILVFSQQQSSHHHQQQQQLPQSFMKKKKNDRLSPKLDYFFSPCIVAVYELMLYAVDLKQFETLNVVPLHVNDFVAQWTAPIHANTVAHSSLDFVLSVAHILRKYCQFMTHMSACSFIKQSPFNDNVDISYRDDSEGYSLDVSKGNDVSSRSASPAHSPMHSHKKQRPLMFRFVVESLLPRVEPIIIITPHTHTHTHITLEPLVAACVSMLDALAGLGAFEDNVLEVNFIELALTIFHQYPLAAQLIVSMLTSFLRNHIQYTNKFLSLALSSVSTRTSLPSPKVLVQDNEWSVQSVFLEALVNNIEYEPMRWLRPVVSSEPVGDESSEKDKYVSESHINVCQLFVACLLLQGSECRLLRGMALRLGAELRVIFDPGYDIIKLVHPSVDVSFAAALRHSGAVACRHIDYLQPMLSAIHLYTNDVNLSDTALLLRLAQPWMPHFGDYLLRQHNVMDVMSSRGCERVGHAAWPVLNTLFLLTKKFMSSPLLDAAICDLWQSLGECYTQEHVARIVATAADEATNLHSSPTMKQRNKLHREKNMMSRNSEDTSFSKYTNSNACAAVVSSLLAFLLFEFANDSSSQLMCQRVAQYFFRCRLTQLFVDSLLEQLPRYDDNAIMDMQRCNSVSVNTPKTQCHMVTRTMQYSKAIAALCMLSDMVFQRPQLFRTHYTQILQSAIALQVHVADQLIFFVAIDLGIQCPVIAATSSTTAAAAAVAAATSSSSSSSPASSTATSFDTVKEFCEALCKEKNLSSLRERWCHLALTWCVSARELSVSRISFDIFRCLNATLDNRCMLHLARLVRSSLSSLHVNELTKYVMMIAALHCPHTQYHSDDDDDGVCEALSVGLAIALTLLHHRHVTAYKLGVTLAQRMLDVGATFHHTFLVVQHEHHHYHDDDDDGVEDGLMQLLLRGVTHTHTLAGVTSIVHDVLLDAARVKVKLGTNSSMIALALLIALLAMMIQLNTLKCVLNTHHIEQLIDVIRRQTSVIASDTLRELYEVVETMRIGYTHNMSKQTHSYDTSCNAGDKQRHASRLHSQISNQTESCRMSSQYRSARTLSSKLSHQGSVLHKHRNSVTTGIDIVCNQEPQELNVNESLHDTLIVQVPGLIRQVLQQITLTMPHCPATILKMLQTVLKFGESTWRKPCLWIAEALLDSFDCEVDEDLFRQLSDIVVMNSYAPDEDTMMAAETIGVLLFENAPKSYRSRGFSFLRTRSQIRHQRMFSESLCENRFGEGDADRVIVVFDDAIVPLLRHIDKQQTCASPVLKDTETQAVDVSLDVSSTHQIHAVTDDDVETTSSIHVDDKIVSDEISADNDDDMSASLHDQVDDSGNKTSIDEVATQDEES